MRGRSPISFDFLCCGCDCDVQMSTIFLYHWYILDRPKHIFKNCYEKVFWLQYQAFYTLLAVLAAIGAKLAFTVAFRSVSVATSAHQLAAPSLLSILLLTAIGAKPVGPHCGLKRCQSMNAIRELDRATYSCAEGATFTGIVWTSCGPSSFAPMTIDR